MSAFVIAVLGLGTLIQAQEIREPFPDRFLFGVGTAAYQVEGAWNETDKGESIWDYLTHNNRDVIADRSNADVASDSYNHIDDDVALLKNLGVNFYRFSISWPRILPTGLANRVSPRGLRYYHELIDALVENDIDPMVTLYHWDLPNSLQKLGGWANPTVADLFTDYAQIVFENFGSKVKKWITFSDPATFCKGYGASNLAPTNLKMTGIGEYLCAKTVLLAHANAYHLYENTYKSRQKGEVGIALQVTWYQPNSTRIEDIEAANTGMQFSTGMFAHPIFSLNGDYPEDLRMAIDRRSLQEGYSHTRLPVFTEAEVQHIKGTADFFGINYYTAVLAAAREPMEVGAPSLEKDIDIVTWRNPSWGSSVDPNIQFYQAGFRYSLQWVRTEYATDGLPMYITENGWPDRNELDDDTRVSILRQYLQTLKAAVFQGINVVGYTAWSLIDSFAWLDGYENRYGLHHVNFSDPERPRTIKKSGEYYKRVVRTKSTYHGDLGTNEEPFDVDLTDVNDLLDRFFNKER